MLVPPLKLLWVFGFETVLLLQSLVIETLPLGTILIFLLAELCQAEWIFTFSVFYCFHLCLSCGDYALYTAWMPRAECRCLNLRCQGEFEVVLVLLRLWGQVFVAWIGLLLNFHLWRPEFQASSRSCHCYTALIPPWTQFLRLKCRYCKLRHVVLPVSPLARREWFLRSIWTARFTTILTVCRIG